MHAIPKNSHMLRAIESVHEVTTLMYSRGFFFDADDIAHLRKHLARLARHYQLLAAQYDLRVKLAPEFQLVIGHLEKQALRRRRPLAKPRL